MTDALVAAIADLAGEVRALRLALADRPAPGPVTVARDTDADVLKAIAMLLEADLPFVSAEVIDAAGTDARLTSALQAAGAETAGKLGCLLRRIQGRDLDGLRVVRDGDGWLIEAVD